MSTCIAEENVPTLSFFRGILQDTAYCLHLSVFPVLIYVQIFYSISFGFGKNVCSLLSTCIELFLSGDEEHRFFAVGHGKSGMSCRFLQHSLHS